jgi:hypothetical protein
MAKRSYLEMTNLILRRINEDDVTTTTSMTGKASIVGDLINDGQNMLFAEADWYTLYKERIFQTSDDAVLVVLDYTGLSSATITITYNGTAYTITEGTDFAASTNNRTTAQNIATALDALSWSQVLVQVNTATASIIVKADPQNNAGISAIATSDDETNLDVTLSDNDTYGLATDFGRAIALIDYTNNKVLEPANFKYFDLANPNLGSSGTPSYYSIQGGNYRLHPVPSATNIILEKYWKEPLALTASDDYSDLPLEAENALLKWVEGEIWLYLNHSQKSVLIGQKFVQLLEKAIETNDNILDEMRVVNSNTFSQSNTPLSPPQLPSHYPR